jgi:hypothetical protein
VISQPSSVRPVHGAPTLWAAFTVYALHPPLCWVLHAGVMDIWGYWHAAELALSWLSRCILAGAAVECTSVAARLSDCAVAGRTRWSEASCQYTPGTQHKGC